MGYEYMDMGYEDLSIHASVGMTISVAVSRDRHNTEWDSSRLEISIESLTPPVKVLTIPFFGHQTSSVIVTMMMTMTDMIFVKYFTQANFLTMLLMMMMVLVLSVSVCEGNPIMMIP